MLDARLGSKYASFHALPPLLPETHSYAKYLASARRKIHIAIFTTYHTLYIMQLFHCLDSCRKELQALNCLRSIYALHLKIGTSCSGCHKNLKINKSRELELKYGRLNKSAAGKGGMKRVGSFFEKKIRREEFYQGPKCKALYILLAKLDVSERRL